MVLVRVDGTLVTPALFAPHAETVPFALSAKANEIPPANDTTFVRLIGGLAMDPD